MAGELNLRRHQPYRAGYTERQTGCKHSECPNKEIKKGQLRISHSLEVYSHNFDYTNWYHFDCFFEVHSPESTGDIAHFCFLKYVDYRRIEEKIGEKNGKTGVAKPIEKSEQEEEREIELKKQSDLIYYYIGELENFGTTKQGEELINAVLGYNGYEITTNLYKKIERLADAMVFGALRKCKICLDGQIYSRNGGYICSECDYESMEQRRKEFLIQKEWEKQYKKQYPLLANCENNLGERIFPMIQKPVHSTNPFTICDSSGGQQSDNSRGSSSKQTVSLDDILAVDEPLKDKAVVHKEGDDVYSEVLYKVDLWKNSNSYYKLQVLKQTGETVYGKYYWVYRAWGRIGTDRGDTLIKPFYGLKEAKALFEKLFERKTGNRWSDRDNFIKKKFLYNRTEEKSDDSLSPLEKVVSIIFDDYLIDKKMRKMSLIPSRLMPLGELSGQRIGKAYEVLRQINEMIDSGEDQKKFIKPSEKLYELIPHDVGDAILPTIFTKEQVQEKKEMLEVLSGMEVTLRMKDEVKKPGDPVGVFEEYYKKLKTDLTLVEQTDDDYKIIQEYFDRSKENLIIHKTMKKTDIFKVNRHAEEDLNLVLHKKMLLWHGSRVTNFACILSDGLMIAPEDVQISGCRFGRGIYFSDQVSKSAVYCYPGDSENIGLILLCEVALGEIEEMSRDKPDITAFKDGRLTVNLPDGKHSVKAVGRKTPDPSGSKFIEYNGSQLSLLEKPSDNATEVPCGEVIQSEKETPSLENEFIVYREKQIKLRYLIVLEFEDK